MRALIPSGAAALLLSACSGGSVDFVEDAELGGGIVRGFIDGNEFVLRQGSTMRMHRGHYRFAMFLMDVETEECGYMPDQGTYSRVTVGLPLEEGTWTVGDPEMDVGRLNHETAEAPFSGKIVSGWARVDEVYDPNFNRDSWVSGALEFRSRDGSWVAGRFEEVPLCYFEP